SCPDGERVLHDLLNAPRAAKLRSGALKFVSCPEHRTSFPSRPAALRPSRAAKCTAKSSPALFLTPRMRYSLPGSPENLPSHQPTEATSKLGKNMVPKKLFFTKGVGKHKDRLTSFELALRDAGIASQNLVRVSSIF